MRTWIVTLIVLLAATCIFMGPSRQVGPGNIECDSCVVTASGATDVANQFAMGDACLKVLDPFLPSLNLDGAKLPTYLPNKRWIIDEDQVYLIVAHIEF